MLITDRFFKLKHCFHGELNLKPHDLINDDIISKLIWACEVWSTLNVLHTYLFSTERITLQYRQQCAYTGWPRKNATLTINNLKKTGDRMKKLWALLRMKFFSHQDDTKIVNFDKGVLILWPFF